MSGHLWQVTEQRLTNMGIPLRDETTQQALKLTSQCILTVAPQLLCFPTSQILETACFLLSYPCGANSTAVIKGDPLLLTYLVDDLQYGLEEYLPNMMFMGNGTLAAQMIQTQLKLSPTFSLQLIRMPVSPSTISPMNCLIVVLFCRGRCRRHPSCSHLLSIVMHSSSLIP